MNKDKATPVNPRPTLSRLARRVYSWRLSNRDPCVIALTVGHCDKAAHYGIFIPIISATGEARLQSASASWCEAYVVRKANAAKLAANVVPIIRKVQPPVIRASMHSMGN
jgi:hypothetical protein